MSIKFNVRVLPAGKMPKKAHPTDAAYDIYARLVEPITILPGHRQTVPGGFEIELKRGYKAHVLSRSGLARNYGIQVFNAPGLIDADYRDEVGVILKNGSNKPFTVNPGDRIAQFVIEEVLQTDLVEVETIDKTVDRGGGFGSTGTK